ncbi:Mur ligase [Scleroderma yunnanense]
MATRNYQIAIDHLNTLQTSAADLEAAKGAHTRINPNPIPKMIEFLERIDYTCEDLNKLNVIHITGTKGKGSTSAFTDSILRHAKPNWKVGLYTSPHLVAVRERIRIGGKPLSEEVFTKYFFDVWDRLQKNGPRTPDFPAMPNYFRYLTLMAFHVFLSEKVDATILEVGVGGLNDSTNIVPKPIVTGITALGLDHMSVLGRTIEAIAEKKGGIYKNGVPALSVNQPEEGLRVLKEKAKELQASYFMEVASFPGSGSCIKLGLAGEHQFQNAALAVQMVHIFLRSVDASDSHPGLLSQLPEPFITGLVNTKWPGRCQTVHDPIHQNTTWYLDGAHTSESLSCCMQWFVRPNVGLPAAHDSRPTRFLIFNCTKGRSGLDLIGVILDKTKELLHQHDSEEKVESFFDTVIFCSNVTYADGHFKGDLTSRSMSTADLQDLQKQHELADIWTELLPIFPRDAIYVVASIEHAIQTLQRLSNPSDKTNVLVTGSLHLVGGVVEVAGLSSVAL